MGMTRAIEFYGLGMQGFYGDQTAEKPPFYKALELTKWKAWEAYKGYDRKVVMQRWIVMAERLLREYGHQDLIKNQYRPGPNYYSDCIMTK